MSHHHSPPHITRVFISCSPTYTNRRALMEALGSIFLDTIEEQREYYYFACPVLAEILEDGFMNRAIFHEMMPGDGATATALKTLKFSHVVAGGDDAFVAKLLSDIGVADASLVRLA